VSEPLELRILGAFEARRDGRALELPAGKARALLALLLLHRSEVVSVDTLVDGLWGERPPATAAKNVQVYVSHLRKTLGDGTLLTRAPGYVLRLEPGQLDADRFQALLEEARGQQPAQAAERLRAALALWRGEALADFRYDSFAQEEIRRLEELRLAALEERIEAELALGRHEDVLSELESLARANPLRERLQGQLMLALYRCGRQAEALEGYRAARRRLVEELGLEPSPELQRLERAILEHDPSLASPPRIAPPGPAAETAPSLIRAHRGRLLVAAGVIVLAAAAVGAGLRLSGGGSQTLRASPNSVAVVDARHDSVRQVIEDVGRLGGITAGAHAVWATDTANDFLLRLDPTRGTVRDRIEVGDGPTGVAVGDGQVWVINQLDRTVSEVNPRARRQVDTFPVGNGANAIAFGDSSVWVANDTDGTLSRINPAGSTRTKTIPLVGTPAGIAIGPQGVWVTSPSTGELLLVDPKINQVVQRTLIGNGPTGIAVGSGAVWVANTPDATVSRFDPGSANVGKIPVGDSPVGIACGGGAVWVANSQSGTVSRLDPKTRSRRDVEVGNEPTSLAFAGGDIWTTVHPSPASHRGGTLRVVSYPNQRSLDSIDPAQPTAFAQLPMLSLTNDGLVTYRRVGGLGGNQLVPDLATALPKATNGGLTYTFHLHRGIRYSNGQPVRPQDFRRGLERVFGLRAYGWFYQGILGGRACERRPQACDLSRGIVADDTADTVTFHLTAADGNFLYKLAFPAADAVPKGAPPDSNVGRKPLPATGPYMTRSFSPGRSWILTRNPRFHLWSADAQPDGYPDRIVMTQYGEHQLAAQVAGIEHGSADVLFWPGLRYLERLATRFASQLHSDPLGITSALAMNTRVPPFDRLAVRRALNYAIDRNRIVQYLGGPLLARPTCQFLAPTQPGYRPYCPYTTDPGAGGSWTAPDYARAAKLVQASGTRGRKVTLLIEPPDPNTPTVKVGRYVVSVLDQLGYRASLKVVPPGAPYFMMGNPRSHLQIGWITWNVFFSASPSDFVNDLSCDAFSPRSSTNANVAEFCSPRIDAQVRRASKLLAQNPAAAADAWNRVDRELADEAPLVALFNARGLVLLSARVGNYEYHPFWNVLFDQLWVR
jgi:ABC-type transport system substrate-binding protein/DNA-binding SARP family transcriptional activator